MLYDIVRPGILKARRAYHGWWVAVASSLHHIYSAGSFSFGFTAFFNPIVAEFGWSYAQVSLGAAFRGFETGVLAPIAGIWADRFGPRRLMVAGSIIMGLGFLLLSRVESLWSFYVMVIVLGVGLSLCSIVVTMTAVTNWFGTKSSIPTGLVTAGTGLAGLLVPAIVWAVDAYGWRQAMVFLGLGAWVLGPLALIIRNPNPGALKLARPTSVEPENPPAMTTREIMRQRNFWLLSVAVFFGGIGGMAVTVHQIPAMLSAGVSRQEAGTVAIIFALSLVSGRLLSGWLGSFLRKKACFAVSAGLKAAGVLGFAYAGTVNQFIAAVIILGIGFGGLVPLRAVLQIEHFGTRGFGAVQGILMTFVTIGSVVAPPFAGWVFDTTGSYQPAFVLLAIATFLATPTILLLSRKSSTMPG